MSRSHRSRSAGRIAREYLEYSVSQSDTRKSNSQSGSFTKGVPDGSEVEALRKLKNVEEELTKKLLVVQRVHDCEKHRETDLINEVNRTRASVRELYDGVSKAKRREVELWKQIDLWVTIIERHKEALLREDNRENKFLRENTILCDEIERNLQLLRHKQKSVDEKVNGRKNMENHHRNDLKEQRVELSVVKHNLKMWDMNRKSNRTSILKLIHKKNKLTGDVLGRKKNLRELEEHCVDAYLDLERLLIVNDVDNKIPNPTNKDPMQQSPISAPQRALELDLRPKGYRESTISRNEVNTGNSLSMYDSSVNPSFDSLQSGQPKREEELSVQQISVPEFRRRQARSRSRGRTAPPLVPPRQMPPRAPRLISRAVPVEEETTVSMSNTSFNSDQEFVNKLAAKIVRESLQHNNQMERK